MFPGGMLTFCASILSGVGFLKFSVNILSGVGFLKFSVSILFGFLKVDSRFNHLCSVKFSQFVGELSERERAVGVTIQCV